MFPADGKTLWKANVHPNLLTPGTVDDTVCLLSPRICLEAKTGKILWENKDRPGYAQPAAPLPEMWRAASPTSPPGRCGGAPTFATPSSKASGGGG